MMTVIKDYRTSKTVKERPSPFYRPSTSFYQTSTITTLWRHWSWSSWSPHNSCNNKQSPSPFSWPPHYSRRWSSPAAEEAPPRKLHQAGCRARRWLPRAVCHYLIDITTFNNLSISHWILRNIFHAIWSEECNAMEILIRKKNMPMHCNYLN